MTAPPRPGPGEPPRPAGSRLLLAGSVLLPLALLLAWGERSWRAEWARAADHATRNAGLVREFARGVLDTQAAILDHAAALAESAEAAGRPAAALHAKLAALHGAGAPLSLVVVDADGILYASSRRLPVRVDVSQRGFFQALRDGPASIHIERAVLRPNGQDAVVVARRRPGPGFRGVVAATLPITAFTDFFGRIAADDRAAASLMRADGVLLLRHTAGDAALQLPPDAPVRRAVALAPAGTYVATAQSDGLARVYGYARVGDLPLYANFGVARGEVVEAWLRGMATVAALLLLTAASGCALVLSASRRMRAEADRALLDEARRRADLQEVLLRELHHRVKNSLMTVQSLIRIQGTGPEAAETLQRRVLALAQVHDLLHVAHLASRLDLAAFLRRICADPALLPAGARPRLTCDVAPVEVGVELANPLALVVVELLTNAARHAFPDGRPGRVTVTLRANDGQGVLTVADDGVGLPEPAIRRRHSGLGLVERLVAQIHGRLAVRSEGGTAFELTFPLDRTG